MFIEKLLQCFAIFYLNYSKYKLTLQNKLQVTANVSTESDSNQHDDTTLGEGVPPTFETTYLEKKGFGMNCVNAKHQTLETTNIFAVRHTETYVEHMFSTAPVPFL